MVQKSKKFFRELKLFDPQQKKNFVSSPSSFINSSEPYIGCFDEDFNPNEVVVGKEVEVDEFGEIIDKSYGQKQIFFQEPATTYMERIIDLHHEIFFFLIILSVLVL